MNLRQTKPPLDDSLRQLIGQPVAAIDTPALVVDLDAMQRNLARMADFARKHGIRWRAHAKMHKSSAIARLQVQAGAVGVCVQKTAEAEAMVAGGVHDVYITNEVIAPQKLARVAQLASRLAVDGGRLGIAVDSREGIVRLAQAMNDARQALGGGTVIDVYVEIDVGQGRCGVPPGRAATELVHEIRRHPALRFAGLQAYHGKAQHVRTPQARRELIAQAAQDAAFTRKLIEADGVPVPLVTGAGTGSMVCETASGVYGELQAGSFLFMDADYAQNERDPAQPNFEHALFVKTQVISAGLRHAVCDAGHKSHAIDSGLPTVHDPDGEHGLAYDNGGDEHGILRPLPGRQRLPEIGRTLWLVPGHCDPTVNLHDHLVGVKGGLVQGTVDRIIRVDARGALT
ncbi:MULTISPECIES: DSD1 family PLP-dependent enzyme [Ramlibacter]|uniref:DSD1 family PLP-dependent enzyme n=1 Tax=Ramlibacter pinisoli TaxID=2682844 RepID=A0A6N8J2Q4_9BURK|nr:MULTISPECIES: DSD1 family PLP-dependent enzyme [Ramlibacter]MBA2962648.1 DSD1 family PLP-dependent enzyme [Ramlibacter sp. CGMCC 1.13660]MVQ32590.1 DSD1 family PLP-dependent enzyme [Ramlibacter pinisoli]